MEALKITAFSRRTAKCRQGGTRQLRRKTMIWIWIWGMKWSGTISPAAVFLRPPAEEASTSDLVRINGITYLFNEKGNPVYGLRRLRIGNTDEYACYYFGNKATSSVVKGKGTVEEGDGTKSDFYFSSSGRGYTGVRDGYLYYAGKKQEAVDGTKYMCYHVNGKLQKAESGTKYEAIKIDNKVYLVSTSGKIVKSTTVKDSSGTKYKTNSSGQIIQVDEQSDDGKSLAREPIEPDYWED